MRPLRVFPCVWAALVLVQVLSAAQQQTYRRAVDTVPIYATVTDSEGALVAKLQRDDFQVEDNGKLQQLTVFEAGARPAAMAVLVDRSPSLFPKAAQSRDAVGEFLRHLASGDRACLGTFSHVVSLDPSLTADPTVLLKHLGDDVPFPAGTAFWDALEAGRAALAREAGRRVVIVITDAADNCSRAEPDAVRTRLVRDGVMVYAVGLSGRDGLMSGDLISLAKATGGAYVEVKAATDVPATMQRIADELHAQYVLGFSASSLDDKVHRLNVKIVKRGLTVRARRAYVASSHEDLR